MLMTDLEINERLISPDNLLNRLHKSTNRSVSNLPIIDTVKVSIPALPARDDSNSKTVRSENREPTIDELIESVDTKVSIGKAHTSAIDVLNSALHELKYRVSEIESPEKLSRIASDMSKIISNSTPSKKEDDAYKSQVIIWKPMMIAIDDMNVIHAND